MRGRWTLALLLPCLGAVACNQDAENPFDTANRTKEPKADADLLFVSNGWASDANGARELYAVRADGQGLERLTSFNGSRRTDVLEAAEGTDRKKAVLRRRVDSNGDGKLDAQDGAALVVVDLQRGAEAELLQSSWRVDGIDWSPSGGLLIHSSLSPQTGREDLYIIEPNGANPVALTSSADVRERRPRMDPSGTVAVYERVEGTAPGQVWVFQSQLQQFGLTTGGTPGAVLAGSPYRVGSDADPDVAPDSSGFVFRRLTGTCDGVRGCWDLIVGSPDGSTQTVIASGAKYRGAPDWGPKGITFVEVDPATRQPVLVLVASDGTNRRALVTLPAGYDLAYPRWLP